MNYFLSIPQHSKYDNILYAVLSFLLVLLSTELSWFSKADVSTLKYLSLTAGTMVAVAHLYGKSGVIGTFFALMFYYAFVRSEPTGAGYLYTLAVTISLFIVISVFDKVKKNALLTRLAFCVYIFLVPGLAALFLALFTPSYFPTEAALNLYLSDSIGILITAPLIVMVIKMMNRTPSLKAYFESIKNQTKAQWILKSLLVSAIFLVLFADATIPGNNYYTFMLLAPLMLLAVFNFSELTQVILMMLGYFLLFESTDIHDLQLLNTKMALFAMFSLCIYMMLDYKWSLKQQIQKNINNLYLDSQSDFGTFQKLDATTLNMTDFVVAAIDLRPIFKYPLEKRDRILRQIALFFKHHTALHDKSYMLYDISSLVVLIENTEAAIIGLGTLPEKLGAYLKERNINFAPDRIYYCRCQKGIRIKQTVNRLYANIRLAERHSDVVTVNCDDNVLDDYIAFLENVNSGNTELLRQNYLNIASPEKVSFELLSRFSIEGKPLNTALVFQCAQKLGYLEHLEDHVMQKQLKYMAALDPMTYDKGSINLTPEFLSSIRAVKALIEQTVELGLAPEKLTLEIVESGNIENTQTLLEALNLLKLHGFKLALDDFGAGHATYNQLLTMPVDSVKIDGSLVRHCPEDPIKQKIIENLKSVADTLSLEVVAECVETQEEADYLKSMGIDYIQGYFFHKPAAAL